MRVLVIGINGMLGSAVFKTLSADASLTVFGTLRSRSGLGYFPQALHAQILCNTDALDQDALTAVLKTSAPDVVINCVGLVKQLDNANNPLLALPVNAMLPHRLAALCGLCNARLIHISTDCVFSGRKGMYLETDTSDAEDLYGKSKYIGEVSNSPHVITLRTSIIGHGVSANASLVDWFLSQNDTVHGYRKAIFSGLPTTELARVIKAYVLRSNLHGLYHVSADPIDKFTLLTLVAKAYQKQITLIPNDDFCIDRSLNSSLFRQLTGYQPPAWPDLIAMMHTQR